MKKWWLWPLSSAVFIVIVINVNTILFPASPEPGSGKNADSFCLELLANKSHKEATQWLNEASSNNKRLIGEQNSAGSRKIVEDLYEMGAVNVEAVDFEMVAGYGEGTNILIVTLPKNADQRKLLFSYEARTATAEGFDPISDDGQNYMFLYKFKLSFVMSILRMLGIGDN